MIAKKRLNQLYHIIYLLVGIIKKTYFWGDFCLFLFFSGGGDYYICYLICFLIKAAVFNLLGIWKLFTIKWLLAYLHVYLYFFIFYLIFNYVYIDDFLYIYIFMHCVLIFFQKYHSSNVSVCFVYLKRWQLTYYFVSKHL